MEHNGHTTSLNFSQPNRSSQAFPGITTGIYSGVVVGNMLPNNLIHVKLDGGRIMDCVWAAGIISGLLGIKLNYIPPIETRVLVFVPKTQGLCYIIGSYPDNRASLSGSQQSVTDPNASSYANSEVFKTRGGGAARMSQVPPIDLTEGDLDMTNLMGVGVSLLRHLSTLQAGDLARVECHLLDDMVRIISGTYVHHSAFGDMRITNDGGKLNVEWNGTSLNYEAWGAEHPADPKVKVTNKTEDHVSLDSNSQIDGFNDDGRWRFTSWLGWLGNFIHLFVTDPPENLGKLAAGQVRSGKFHMHVNNDGSFLLQSVSDIVLEKVVRIPVPIRKKREDDPEGNRSDGSIKEGKGLTLWQPSDGLNVFEMAFQLREYARWLNNTYSLARFRQLDQDFKVPSEADTPAPDPLAAEEDKKIIDKAAEIIPTVPTTFGYRMAYSCIRIFRDGSIVLWDGYGNSVSMSDNGIQISSTSDLQLEAAGSINMIAGKEINMVARQSVNLTSVLDTVRIAALTSIQTLVKAGHFVMDFLVPGRLKVRNGTLNVNDCFGVGLSGNVDALGNITGLFLSASVTEGPHGYISHMGHVFQGVPNVIPSIDEFRYPVLEVPKKLYQSLAQSTLVRLEQIGFDVQSVDNITVPWPLLSNIVPGKGSPWPGESATMMVAGGVSLNSPAISNPGSTPRQMIPRPVVMQVKI